MILLYSSLAFQLIPQVPSPPPICPSTRYYPQTRNHPVAKDLWDVFVSEAHHPLFERIPRIQNNGECCPVNLIQDENSQNSRRVEYSQVANSPRSRESSFLRGRILLLDLRMKLQNRYERVVYAVAYIGFHTEGLVINKDKLPSQ